MKRVRVIPKLDVKGPNVVKGIQLEGLRVIGKPAELAKKYYDQGADEILYIDIVASLYERNNLMGIVEETTSSGVYVPLTVGGGVRSVENVKQLLRAGADKVAINTAATRRPEIITEAAEVFGSQCIVGSIEAKQQGEGKWEAYVDNGRERTGLDALEWAKKLAELGAGELLITSVDRDGTKKGFDTQLISKIVNSVSIPVVACGGAGKTEDIPHCFEKTKCDGVAFGSILHYNTSEIGQVKTELESKGILIRASVQSPIFPKKYSGNKTVSIVDYGAGNLRSVINAFKSIGAPVRVVSTPEEIQSAELLVLPGDGAFGYAINQLQKLGLETALKEYAAIGKPLFGICLGMQLLMSESEEFGRHNGLGIIPGSVIPFREPGPSEDKAYTVPHIGWNSLMRPSTKSWEGTMLQDAPDGSLAYFVHSFYVRPANPEDSLANTTYGDQEFCTVLQKNNIYATQFHPEKSGESGINMLRYFCNL